MSSLRLLINHLPSKRDLLRQTNLTQSGASRNNTAGPLLCARPFRQNDRVALGTFCRQERERRSEKEEEDETKRAVAAMMSMEITGPGRKDPQVAPLKNLFPLFLLLRWPRPIVAAVVGFRVVHVVATAVVVTIPSVTRQTAQINAATQNSCRVAILSLHLIYFDISNQRRTP